MTSEITPTPGAKMQYLIRRRAGVSREDLIANWFANHMPDVIASQHAAKEKGRPHASRYIATLFEPDRAGEQAWDGVAQLWWPEPTPRPAEPHGATPRDTFQQRCEPYVPWPTREFVVLDGELPVEPNTLNDPFPCTRSGVLKVTSLLSARPDIEPDALFTHWLNVHAPNVRSVMEQVGGIRYAISQSLEPEIDQYIGMAELWLPSRAELRAYNETYVSDGIEDMVDMANSVILRSHTELIGIP